MGYRVAPLPRDRLRVLDLLNATRFKARYTVHGLIEADVTEARGRLRKMPKGRASVTAFVVASLARAVRQHPEVNARRVGRRLVFFDDVDIIVTVERRFASGPAPSAWRVRNGEAKGIQEIAADLETAKTGSSREPDPGRLMRVMRFPRLIRKPAVRLLAHVPSAAVRFGPAIGVSSLGMFGPGWGIPLSPMTLMVTVGGISRRLALRAGAVEEREMLPLTLSFDHSVIDGAPAARFATTFRELLESAAPLDYPGSGPRGALRSLDHRPANSPVVEAW